MSARLIALSPDLKRLRDDGYDIVVRDGYLIMRDVPYVGSGRKVLRGALVSTLNLAGDRTGPPDTHTIFFVGEFPCDQFGSAIEKIRLGAHSVNVAGMTTSHQFSAKPTPSGRYADYHAKLTTYANILGGPARVLDSNVTAATHPLIQPDDQNSVFRYVDTASSRADIVAAGRKLELGKVGIIGLGGTGSYVLDLVAKTPVREIHLFDGDTLFQHNAFRSPGAASVAQLAERPPKVVYLERIYGEMRRGIVAHAESIRGDNLGLLAGLDFVFLCMEGGATRLIVDRLEALDTPFVDVGMGLFLRNDAIGGLVRTTSSTSENRSASRIRIPMGDADEANEYARNIQIADLNALNAAFAVIRWKKYFGFYLDEERELFSAYSVAANDLTNSGGRG
jgi:hypothetical protein